MLSNPPLNYGPELGGAASADPVETENYEALLNLGTEASILRRLSLFIHSLRFLLAERKMRPCCRSSFLSREMNGT
jgi:hypothetical protein